MCLPHEEKKMSQTSQWVQRQETNPLWGQAMVKIDKKICFPRRSVVQEHESQSSPGNGLQKSQQVHRLETGPCEDISASMVQRTVSRGGGGWVRKMTFLAPGWQKKNAKKVILYTFVFKQEKFFQPNKCVSQQLCKNSQIIVRTEDRLASTESRGQCPREDSFQGGSRCENIFSEFKYPAESTYQHCIWPQITHLFSEKSSVNSVKFSESDTRSANLCNFPTWIIMTGGTLPSN